MTTFKLSAVKRVLCLGAHSDDIEIGCGGTLLKLIRANPGLEVRWVVFSGKAPRQRETRRSAAFFLQGVRRATVQTKSFKDGFFPEQWAGIKAEFERTKRAFDPDLVLTHYREDRHQDHRVLSDLAWNTFRDHLILEYEIPKYDGDLGQPNVYVTLEHDVCEQKIAGLMQHFATQRNKHWFTPDTFKALLRLRGIECASPTGWAEAFHGRKIRF